MGSDPAPGTGLHITRAYIVLRETFNRCVNNSVYDWLDPGTVEAAQEDHRGDRPVGQGGAVQEPERRDQDDH